MELKISKAAQVDIRDVGNYYIEKDLPAQAEEFLFKLKESLNVIKSHPEIGSPRFLDIIKNKQIRYFVLSKYNYYVFYEVVKKEVKIIRILNSKRDIFKILG